jgi:hypothetical protein
MTVNGATDAEGFRTSVKQVLGPPALAPGDLVVPDHRSAHKATAVAPDDLAAIVDPNGLGAPGTGEGDINRKTH